MKTFTIPVVITTTGWIRIQADSRAEARAQAEKLNENGIPLGDIHDSSSESECMLDEIEAEG